MRHIQRRGQLSRREQKPAEGHSQTDPTAHQAEYYRSSLQFLHRIAFMTRLHPDTALLYVQREVVTANQNSERKQIQIQSYCTTYCSSALSGYSIILETALLMITYQSAMTALSQRHQIVRQLTFIVCHMYVEMLDISVTVYSIPLRPNLWQGLYCISPWLDIGHRHLSSEGRQSKKDITTSER